MTTIQKKKFYPKKFQTPNFIWTTFQAEHFRLKSCSDQIWLIPDFKWPNSGSFDQNRIWKCNSGSYIPELEFENPHPVLAGLSSSSQSLNVKLRIFVIMYQGNSNKKILPESKQCKIW